MKTSIALTALPRDRVHRCNLGNRWRRGLLPVCELSSRMASQEPALCFDPGQSREPWSRLVSALSELR